MKLTSNIHCIALLLLMSLTACDTKEEKGYSKETINSTKLCPQVTYACLSETKDKDWKKTLLETDFEFYSSDLFFIRQKVIEKVFEHYKVDKGIDENGKDAFDQLRYKIFNSVERENQGSLHSSNKGYKKMASLAISIAAEFMKKSKEELMSDEFYQLTEREERDITLRRKQRRYIEIAQMMDLFFPGFWKGTPKEEQIKWIMQTERLAKKYEPNSNGISESMAIICGMIGLDFDTKSENEPIVSYLSSISEIDYGQMSDVLNYLLFMYHGLDYNLSGNHLNTWSMRDALGKLPRPERHVPRFTEEVPETGMYLEKHDIWKVYETTIKDKGIQ